MRRLTTFWEQGGKSGKCIRIFTRVHLEDYHRRLEEMKQEEPPPPRKPREVRGKGYNTVEGNDGVGYWSDRIDVRSGMRYMLSADVRSEARRRFVKGDSELPAEIEEGGEAKTVRIRRVTFQVYLDCRAGREWRTSSITFCPTHDREDVKWMRVMLYGYRPPQNYGFDNIRIVEAGQDPEAPRRWAAKREKAENQASEGWRRYPPAGSLPRAEGSGPYRL